MKFIGNKIFSNSVPGYLWFGQFTQELVNLMQAIIILTAWDLWKEECAFKENQIWKSVWVLTFPGKIYFLVQMEGVFPPLRVFLTLNLESLSKVWSYRAE